MMLRRLASAFCFISLVSCQAGQTNGFNQAVAFSPNLSIESQAAYERLIQLSGMYFSLSGSDPVSEFGFQAGHSNASIAQIWQRPGQPIHSSTIFFMDSGILHARHYCPHANQPLLRLTKFDGAIASFEFVSMTGDQSGPHLHNLRLQLNADETIGYRSIYFTGNEENEPWDVTFDRIQKQLFE